MVPGPWVDDELRSLVGATLEATSSQSGPAAAPARFRLEQPLGEGGTGVAFFALRQSDQGEAPHVVKVFRPNLLLKAPEIAEVSKRKEHTAMKRLNERFPPSPYIVRMVDTGELEVTYKDGAVILPWIASEFVNGGLEGTTLTERITRAVEATGVGWDPERVVRALRCITEGLAVIHELGVIHRDIKPDNILLCGFADDEVAKITDFGVARAQGLETTFGPQPIGTLGYAAPEQLGLLVAPTTEATDIFALGVLLFKMLSAEDYFRRIPFAQLAMRRDDSGVDPRPRLRDSSRLHPEFAAGGAHLEEIDAAIRKATSVRPENRFASAREFRAAVDRPLRTLVRPITAKGRRSATRERLRTIMMQVGARTSWTTRHRPGDDRVLRSVAWEPDGRCLGVTREGLVYWDGRAWFQVPMPAGLEASAIRFVLRLAAGHFLLGGDKGLLIELSEAGWGQPSSADPRLLFERAAGSLDHTLALAATSEGASFLYIASGGSFRPALQLEHASAINGIDQLDDTHFVLVGRSQAGGAYVSVYDSAAHAVVPFLATMRPLLAVASDHDGCAYAVGPGGLAVAIRLDPQLGASLALEQVGSERDLSSVAIDPMGVAWATAQGRVLKRVELSAGTPKWEAVHVYDWLVPVVSSLAAGGGVSIVTVDGAILEGRDERVQVPAPSPSFAPPPPR